MRTLLSSCALLLGTCFVPAQTASPAPATPNAPAPAPAAAPTAAELAATKARLGSALQKAAAQTDTSFKMKWGPDKKGKGDDPMARAMGAMNVGAASGSWHPEFVRIVWDNDNDDELLIAGRRMLAKDGTNDWRVRAARFADGNTMAFVPDVQALLQYLARQDLAVTHRAAASLDDRPVEVVSVTLNADQVADAVWAGLLPEAIVTMMGNGRVFRMFGAMGGGGGARPPAPRPESTIDLAVHLDPATSVVHKLHFRGWTKESAAAGAGAVMVVGAGRVALGGDDEEEEEEEEEGAQAAAARKDAPLVYENGLPARPRKKTSVCDVTVTLSKHGETAAPQLTDAQKQLLGR